MTSIWVESLGTNFDAALDWLAEAVRDCNEELWESSMWPVPGDLFGSEPPGPDGKPVLDPAVRDALVQRRSTPWSVAWHALETLDYDLTAEFGPWAPPPPFTDRPHWLMTTLPRAWTQSEITGYIGYCRQRVRDTLAGMSDDKAAMPLPSAHRYAGKPYAWLIIGAVGHTIEHAAQIQQFVTSSNKA